MMLPTEQVGSIPRPAALIQGVQGCQLGRISQPELDALYEYNAAETVVERGVAQWLSESQCLRSAKESHQSNRIRK